MLKKNLDFYCIGAAHIDTKARAEHEPKLGESTPALTSTCIGGVACNVALNLLKMGARVALCSRVGDDHLGRSLTKVLGQAGIDISDISISPRQPTASYYALLNQVGELFIAVVNMRIYAELTPALMCSLLPARSRVPNWVVDANVSEETIKAIRDAKGPAQNLWGVGVAAFNAERLSAGFPHWRGLFLNKKELQALSGYQDTNDGIKDLVKRGCPLVVVSAGAEGVRYSYEDRIVVEPSHKRQALDVTGAGDALAATIIYDLSQGETVARAVKHGMLAAASMISSLNSSLESL